MTSLRRSSPDVGGLLGQRLEPGALLGDHLVELLGDLVEGAAEVVALELLLAPLAQALHELAQALHLLAVGRSEARVEHAAQRRVGVTVVEQVVGELDEEAVDVVLEPRLGAVPARGTSHRRPGSDAADHPRPR